MSKTLYVGRLPLDGGMILFLFYYAVILGVLIYMTGRLRRDQNKPSETASVPTGAAPLPAGSEPQPVAGGAR